MIWKYPLYDHCMWLNLIIYSSFLRLFFFLFGPPPFRPPFTFIAPIFLLLPYPFFPFSFIPLPLLTPPLSTLSVIHRHLAAGLHFVMVTADSPHLLNSPTSPLPLAVWPPFCLLNSRTLQN